MFGIMGPYGISRLNSKKRRARDWKAAMTQFAMQFEGRFFAGAEAKKASKPPKHKISDTSRLHLASDSC